MRMLCQIALQVAAVLLSYIWGSLSTAVLLGRAFGLPDPRLHGSGNPGTTNMLRLGGKPVAALTLICDVLKGWLPVYLALHYPLPLIVVAAMMLAVFLGQLWPIFFGFKGGKGVATSLGVILAVSPILAFMVIVTWMVVIIATRWVSLASLAAASLAPFYSFLFLPWPLRLALLSLSLGIIVRHHANIERLIKGSEPKLGNKVSL